MSLFPTISCQERKWGKRWVLFFGPRAWGWPACRQEKGNLERFPLRMCQIIHERRRPQGMCLPAENALPPSSNHRALGHPQAPPARVCKCLGSPRTRCEDHQDPQTCSHFPTSRASNKGLTRTNTPTTPSTHPLPIASQLNSPITYTNCSVSDSLVLQ